MARTFSGSTQYLTQASSLTAPPLAMVCWCANTDLTQTDPAVTLMDASDANNYAYIGVNPSDQAQLAIRAGGAPSTIATTTTLTNGVYAHLCGIFAATNDRRLFINGGDKTTSAVTVDPYASLDETFIGAFHDGSSYFTGRICEVAIWDLSVWPGASDTARADNFETAALPALKSGVLPIRFPLGLVRYWPLWGTHSPEADLHPRSQDASDYSMTVTGATSGTHANVMPWSRRFWGTIPQFDEAGGAAGSRWNLAAAGSSPTAGDNVIWKIYPT